MVILDTNFYVLLLLNDASKVPLDPKTGERLEKFQDRLKHLIETLENNQETIVIPTPVYAELMVMVGRNNLHEVMGALEKNKNFQFATFDKKSAIECAHIEINSKQKKSAAVDTKAKVKFDRQIIAIAKSNKVSMIYTDDKGLCTTALNNGISVVKSHELPLPPEPPQGKFDFDCQSPNVNQTLH